MNKTSMFLIILIMSLVPSAFAHPYTNTAVIMGDEGEISVKLIGIGITQKDDNKEPEFLSTAWMWQNFISLLTGVITLTMIIAALIIYRDDLPIKTKMIQIND